MSVVFVSHSSLDKQRIKMVTDRLLREEGIRLWIDRPLDVGYKISDLDSGRILPILGGEMWRRSIRRAAVESHCVLLLASSRVTENERKVWHEEILLGHAREVLIAARLDEEVDLSQIAVLDDITTCQTLDVFLPLGTTNESATSEQLENIEQLVWHVRKKLERPRPDRTQGFFNPSRPSDVAPALPREQVTKLLMMLDREREVSEIAGSSVALGVVGAVRPARADTFLKRLPEVELPCRSTDEPWQRQRVGSINLQSIRTDYIQGRITDTDAQWARDRVPWPVTPRGGIDKAISTFVWSLYERVSRLIAPEAKVDPCFLAEVNMRHLSRASLHSALGRLEHKIFLQTEFIDTLGHRKANRAFLEELSSWLKGVPAGSFRLVVHAIQSEAKEGWFGRSPKAWLEDLGRSGKIVVVTLDQVGRIDLSAWSEMMTLILDTSDDEIVGTLDKVYGTADAMARLPAATLEERLAPEVSNLRPRSTAHPVRVPAQFAIPASVLVPASGK